MKTETINLERVHDRTLRSATVRTCKKGEVVQHGPEPLEIKKDGQIHVELDVDGVTQYMLFETAREFESSFIREDQSLEERVAALEALVSRLKPSSLD